MDNQENNLNLTDEKQIIDAIKILEEEINELKLNILKKEMLLNKINNQMKNL